MKIFQKTFGCQMNVADSDEMIRHFNARGFMETDSVDQADAVLINTCTVRQLAEHKAASYMGRMREWKNDRPGRLLFVTGCAAARAGHNFEKRFPHVDLIVGAKDIETFPQALDQFLDKRVLNEEELVPNRVSLKSTVGPSQAVQFVTIMRGCNYNCSYCIVPAVRGRERYLPVEDVLRDVESRVKEGAKEIWLLGQTVNSYKPENPPFDGYDFADLLRDVNKVAGLERIRFTSPHPFYLTDKLIKAMAECGKVMEYMHLPVQSGSSRVLSAMRRNYTRESYLSAVKKLRAAIPSVVITTDIIAGFPTETKEEFEETLSLVDEADFDSAYCFKYSPRPGTQSAGLADDVPLEEKERRLDLILKLTETKALAKAQALIGTEQEVLIDETLEDGAARGKTRGFNKVRFQSTTLQPGRLLKAHITGTHFTELKGDVLGTPTTEQGTLIKER